MDMQTYMRDRRTPQELTRTYQTSISNEQLAIHALIAYHRAHGYDGRGEEIDPTERNGIDFDPTKKHWHPDWWYWLTVGEREIKTTYEIKCSRYNHWTDGKIYVKRASIWAMISDPYRYPNGKLFACTPRQFGFLPACEVNECPQENVDSWGNKKMFVVREEQIDWHPWLTPVDFAK